MESIDAAPTPSPAPDPATQPEDVYEQLCKWLYAYRYGAIDFLELIAKFEESLGIASPQTKPQDALE